MQVSTLVERKLTELDHARLTRLATTGASPRLAEILDDADVFPVRAIPPDVVTMNAQFVIRHLQLRRRQVVVICYPADADPARGYVSVLSPAGQGLIGLPVGALARWPRPGGEESTVRIEEILFQPEASGDYVT